MFKDNSGKNRQAIDKQEGPGIILSCSGVVQWQDRSFWSCLSGFESLPRNFLSLHTVWIRMKIIMDTEYFRADDLITLTQGEWQELVASIQNLVQANSALLQTVSELMAQRNQAISQHPASSQPVPPADPYDLRTLNHLLTDPN